MRKFCEMEIAVKNFENFAENSEFYASFLLNSANMFCWTKPNKAKQFLKEFKKSFFKKSNSEFINQYLVLELVKLLVN